MSDGLSEANREAEATAAIMVAADKLCDELVDINDMVFGVPTSAIELVNQCLRRAGVKLVRR